jgi:hypothetical protein
MARLKLYHLKTLLFTYLVWLFLSLLLTLRICQMTKQPLSHVPFILGMLHILPFLSLGMFLGEPVMMIIAGIVTGLAILFIVTGLLINRVWAKNLVIMGMIIWFLWEMFVAALAA